MPVTYLYAGTWNNVPGGNLGYAKGIYGWRFDPETGTAEPLGCVAEVPVCSDSLAISRDGRTLYCSEYTSGIAVRSWPFPGLPPAGLRSYGICRDTGALTFLGRVDARGEMAAEFAQDPSGKVLALANFDGGNIVLFSVDGSGALAEAVAEVQHEGQGRAGNPGPHPHGLTFSTDGRTLYVADLGLECVRAYAVDIRKMSLEPAEGWPLVFPDGTGPRNVVAHPNGRWLYLNTEDTGRLIRLDVGPDGMLTRGTDTSLVPNGCAIAMGSAQVRMSPDGRFLYANHRPGEAITVFAVDEGTGDLNRLASVDTGATDPGTRTPWERKSLWEIVETGARSFCWDAAAEWVVSADLGGNALVLLRRDPETGLLARHGAPLPVPQPAFVVFSEVS